VNLGKLKVWIEVANWYYGKVMQIITAFGVLKLLGFSWWVLLLVFLVSIPIIIYIVYLHMRYIYPKEVEYTWEKNPIVKELRNK
jgi:hypothetical protein